MKKNLFVGSVIVAALAVACNNSGSGSSTSDTAAVKTDSGTTTLSPGADTGASAKKPEANPISVSKADSLFMIKAADAGMTEVNLGTIAGTNAANDKVKEFGQMMVKDHSAAGDQLKKIAAARNIMLPDSISKESRKHVADLEKKKGKDFDKAYINMMVEGHQKVLNQFEEEQKKGSDSELKAFVEQTIPVIKGHLDAAKSIKQSMK